ncbi:MAG: type II secretion system F family protein, partial [Methanobrevibacter sp.]
MFFVETVKSFSLKGNENETGKEDNPKVFSMLDFEKSPKSENVENERIELIRNILLKYLFKKRAIPILIIIFILISCFISLELGGIYLVITAMIYVFTANYPQIKEKNSYSDLNQELPYALRHMGIELKSGKGLHDTLITVKNADYGSLSREFNRVLEEVKYGKPTEESLLEMSHRVKSEGLSRTIHQIIGTLRVGGNLANSLNIIAKDISFETQIKLKEYSQK